MPEWRAHYVRYSHLKQLLKNIVAANNEVAAATFAGTRKSPTPFTPAKDLNHFSLSFEPRHPGAGTPAAAAATEAAPFLTASRIWHFITPLATTCAFPLLSSIRSS